MHILVNLATDWVKSMGFLKKIDILLRDDACMIELSEKQRRIIVGPRGNRGWHLMCLLSLWHFYSSRQTLKCKLNYSLSNDSEASGCPLILVSVLWVAEGWGIKKDCLEQGPVSSILRDRDGDEECGWWLFPPKEHSFASACRKVCLCRHLSFPNQI